jgi:hypothetical protein
MTSAMVILALLLVLAAPILQSSGRRILGAWPLVPSRVLLRGAALLERLRGSSKIGQAA